MINDLRRLGLLAQFKIIKYELEAWRKLGCWVKSLESSCRRGHFPTQGREMITTIPDLCKTLRMDDSDV